MSADQELDQGELPGRGEQGPDGPSRPSDEGASSAPVLLSKILASSVTQSYKQTFNTMWLTYGAERLLRAGTPSLDDASTAQADGHLAPRKRAVRRWLTGGCLTVLATVAQANGWLEQLWLW